MKTVKTEKSGIPAKRQSRAKKAASAKLATTTVEPTTEAATDVTEVTTAPIAPVKQIIETVAPLAQTTELPVVQTEADEPLELITVYGISFFAPIIREMAKNGSEYCPVDSGRKKTTDLVCPQCYKLATNKAQLLTAVRKAVIDVGGKIVPTEKKTIKPQGHIDDALFREFVDAGIGCLAEKSAVNEEDVFPILLALYPEAGKAVLGKAAEKAYRLYQKRIQEEAERIKLAAQRAEAAQKQREADWATAQSEAKLWYITFPHEKRHPGEIAREILEKRKLQLSVGQMTKALFEARDDLKQAKTSLGRAFMQKGYRRSAAG